MSRGNIDFLVADYLSEITKSLLAATKQKFPVGNPSLGVFNITPDFLQTCMKPLLKEVKNKGKYYR